jgi:hypothetical protein
MSTTITILKAVHMSSMSPRRESERKFEIVLLVENARMELKSEADTYIGTLRQVLLQSE